MEINHKLLRRISLADAIAGCSRLTWFVEEELEIRTPFYQGVRNVKLMIHMTGFLWLETKKYIHE